VISAAARVDNAKLRKLLGTRRVRFATTEELRQLTGCLPGAVPPFGSLFGLRVLMDDLLMREEVVYFNCASHTLSLRMRREDLMRACQAEVADFHLDS
jgi:Ala-tRNA(Pro) deacylase